LSRLSRHGFAAGFIIGVAVAGVVWLLTSGLLTRSGTIDASYDQIRSIHLQPVPEGPTRPLFVHRPRRAEELPLGGGRSRRRSSSS
jgi:hypothetical protein